MIKRGTYVAIAAKLNPGEFALCETWKKAQGVYRVLKRRKRSTWTKVEYVGGKRMWRVYDGGLESVG